MIAWWRRWRKAKRLSKARASGELREFIYLDGVSVYSLLASRLGPIAQEVTDSYSRSSETEASGKIGGDLIALKAESSARASFNRSSGSEILRKSIIQASFKDLVDLEQERLVLGSSSGTNRDVGRSKKELLFKAPPFAAVEFARGRLLEVDVDLDVEPIYRMNTVLSSMVGITSASPDLFDVQTRAQFNQGRAIEVALHGLLGGLVPIRARVPDYVVRSIKGTDTVVQARTLSTEDHALAHPLYLVGVAEESLFWKDVRRVLFSGGRYTVLARVAASGIQETWNPVKLSHVLDSFAPDLGVQINKMSTLALKDAKKPIVPAHSSRSTGTLLAALLRRLNERGPFAPDQATAAQVVVQRYGNATYSIEGWRFACDELIEVLFPIVAERPSREEMARLRQQVQSDAAPTNPRLVVSRADIDAQNEEPVARYLDCELVAIYW